MGGSVEIPVASIECGGLVQNDYYPRSAAGAEEVVLDEQGGCYDLNYDSERRLGLPVACLILLPLQALWITVGMDSGIKLIAIGISDERGWIAIVGVIEARRIPTVLWCVRKVIFYH